MIIKKPFLFSLTILGLIIGLSLFFLYEKREQGQKKSKKEISSNEDNVDVCQSNKEISKEILENNSNDKADNVQIKREYPVHKNISVTLFWIGEDASEDNKEISNESSAWDDLWVKHFGGTDNPKKRNGFYPSKFTPQENPFYFALPYNDFDKKGKRKKDAASIIPWSADRKFSDEESYCKNRWIKIIKDEKIAYAQWEDVGPFGEDDVEYIFNNAEPKSKTNKHAGLDVSPAVRDYLGISEKDIVDWQFIEISDVPDGPWKRIITKTGICWK